MKPVEKKYLIPFCLITSLFFLWGLANQMTDTLLSAFKRIMSMSDTQTSLIQTAFYGAYFCFALPAAMFIRRFDYKSGVLFGLLLYSAGAMLFFPASKVMSYTFYLIAIYVLAGGCAILETSANPYILSMGTPETATRRLNIAQSFNPIGCITGILLSQFFILSELSSATAEDRTAMTETDLLAVQQHELNAVTGTYMAVGFVLLVVLVLIFLAKMPQGGDDSKDSVRDGFSRLFKNKRYIYGVLALFFYEGAQVGVWSFTIRLAMNELRIVEADAATYYLISTVCFCAARFLFTWLMKWHRPSKLLMWAALGALVLSLGVVLTASSGMTCIAVLIGISFFMSLMFPTIYGLALENVGSDSKIGASGLIMAILGAALITPVQGMVSDAAGINISYLVPMICFAVVWVYAWALEKGKFKTV
ncbi:MAG: L-fucose:H+ symporter permease [Bacteroidales bacterium]|nr:L-fucose:H+ symporter permease [Bacteroidales bacterium]